MLSMQLAGQKIDYKDLAELRGKLTDLLVKLRQDREVHDREVKRLRQDEKTIQKLLGADVPAEEKSGSLV